VRELLTDDEHGEATQMIGAEMGRYNYSDMQPVAPPLRHQL